MFDFFKKSHLPVLDMLRHDMEFYINGSRKIRRNRKGNELDYFHYEIKLKKKVLKYFNISRHNSGIGTSRDLVFLIQGRKINFKTVTHIIKLLSKYYKEHSNELFMSSLESQAFNSGNFHCCLNIQYRNETIGVETALLSAKNTEDFKDKFNFICPLELMQFPEETDNSGLALIIRNIDILFNKHTMQIKRQYAKQAEFSGDVVCENYYRYGCKFKVASFYLPSGGRNEDEVDAFIESNHFCQFCGGRLIKAPKNSYK